MFAIIDYNGNQIKVEEGKEYKIPYFEAEPEAKIKFESVMLLSSGDKVEVGEPYVDGSYVEGTVVNAGQTAKIRVIKFHSKKRYQKIGSHRQDFVTVRINKIVQK